MLELIKEAIDNITKSGVKTFGVNKLLEKAELEAGGENFDFKGGYRRFSDCINELFGTGRLVPVKNSGMNGRMPVLYARYRISNNINKPNEVLKNEILSLHPILKKDYYLSRIAEYENDRDYVLSLNTYLHKSGLSKIDNYRCTINERSFERAAGQAVKESAEELTKVQGDINILAGGIVKLSGAVLRNYGKEHYRFESGESTDHGFYEERRKELDTKFRKLNLKIDEVTSRKSEIEKQLDTLQQFIEDRKIEAPKDMQGDMLQLKGFEESIGLWDVLKMKTGEIAVLFKRYRDRYKEVENELDSTRIKVEKDFDGLYSNEEWKDNATVRRILSGIMKEDLYNIQHMRELFGRLFESVRRMKEAEELHLEECKRNKGELVERCLHRAQTVYDELKLVDSFSKIKIGGQNLKIIKIDIPKLEEEQGRSLMAIYLEKCIEEISSLKEERAYDPAKIDSTISGLMAPQVLLDAVIKLNDISISVYKPEHNMELSQYIPWEIVIQWSGGEKLAGFFAMFISIVTYLRYKKTGWQGSTKVIWIDNPFGQANAGHLLEYIFELAKATNTQMICLTGLQETNIYAQFDVVYSLVHRMLSSMSIIQSKQVKAGQSVEVGYYNLNSEQMSLF